MASAHISGTIFIQDTSGTNVQARVVAVSVVVSQYVTQRIILANGVSNFIVSIASVSIPNVVWMTANSLCRVNFGNHASADSAASLGYQFKDIFAWAGSGQSGPINIHYANSSGDSAIVTLVLGM